MWSNFPSNSRVHAHWFLGSRSQTNLTRTQLHTDTYMRTYTHRDKARATQVMLARASTTFLACAQSPKSLSVAARYWV